ncbi:MAG: pantoate--beta-alanine ligase [Pseudomonadota bacterium]
MPRTTRAMEILRDTCAMRGHVRALKARGHSVGCVLTMGFLHAGHLALIAECLRHADAVCVSIFVNPTQFGERRDLDAYPTDIEGDLAKLKQAGVSAAFLPTPEVMYPEGADTVVVVPGLSDILQGKVRPGHFQGVTTVVSKLFHILEPDVTVFGQKDYQQLAIVRQMVRDMAMPIRVLGLPTVREEDGLAMSSRNVRLTPQDRAASVVLSQALDLAEKHETDPLTAEEFRALVREHIAREPRADIRAIDIRDAATLAPFYGRLTRPAVILLSVRFGEILLIDNRVIGPDKDAL